jgi:hypothetical protein
MGSYNKGDETNGDVTYGGCIIIVPNRCTILILGNSIGQNCEHNRFARVKKSFLFCLLMQFAHFL